MPLDKEGAMATRSRPHSSPPELAKDVLGKLDNARALIERARLVAQRGSLTDSDQRLARLEAEFERALNEVQAAVRDDIRRLLSAGPPPAE